MIVDLFNDFRDGSRLLDLLEVMSGQRLVSPSSVYYVLQLTVKMYVDPNDRLTLVLFCRVGREAGECFSTEAILKRPSPF